ncbi:MAG TPA: TlpA disulfide reductase family protein [Candidatus Saccharimonadia bacterium]|nr:TlpA disulfide reductase family protein [Candidatus Saccharimonadia bacterium]
MLRALLAILLAAMTAMPTIAAAAGLEGKPAPLIELKARDGTAHTLEAITAERPAVVVFWASWCPYCKALLPELAKLVAAYGDDRVAVVAINVWEESKDDAHAYIDGNPHPFTWLMRGNKTAKAWKVKGTPGLFLVGRGGTVRYDRTARPLKADPAAASTPGPAASGPAKSALRWMSVLREELDAELARPQ